MKSLFKRIFVGSIALIIATVIWLPCLQFVFRYKPNQFHADTGLSLKSKRLAARHLELWTEPKLLEQELGKMRASNAEWDFMGRSFLVWSLANMALREPESKATYLQTMDRIIDETLRIEQQEGIYFFLMPYAKSRPFKAQPARSHFLDGEIALMLAMRREVEEKAEYKRLLTDRINLLVERMQSSPVLAAESYPDECWMFDHAVALAAIKIADHLDGNDHSTFFREWIRIAKQKLVHPETGLLISSYTRDGTQMDGPEGSSIWMVAHCLQLIDEDFACDQYQRARKELGRPTLGFSYAREWPISWNGPADIDSGLIIPVLEISAGSSGMALIGASAFADEQFLSSLAGTLDFAAFPSSNNNRLKYCASNQVGDAALLYASVLRPLWQKVKGETKL